MTYKKRKDEEDLIPIRAPYQILSCPKLFFVEEVITLSSCKQCPFHMNIREATDVHPEGEVECCFPRIVPIRGVRGKID